MKDHVDITDLIHRARHGDSQAAEELFAATYQELRKVARARLRAGGRETLLDTVSLVHETYLRFVATRHLELQDRTHFMRFASRAMRSVIVDFARRRQAERRGGNTPSIPITTQIADGAIADESEILRVHEALMELSRLDERMAQIVEMRYFAGMKFRAAQSELLSTRLPIKEIAAKYGFSDVHHFTRRFRQITGTTPGEIRRK